MIEPRPFLVDAMKALELTLQRNDTKPDWMNESPADLLDKAREEYFEMLGAFTTHDAGEKQAEALDLALCALFLWARSGGTLYAKDRGREQVF